MSWFRIRNQFDEGIGKIIYYMFVIVFPVAISKTINLYYKKRGVKKNVCIFILYVQAAEAHFI